MKISNKIRKIHKLIVVGFLLIGIGCGAFYINQVLAATSVPSLASFNPSVWYPALPVALEDQYDKSVSVNLSFHTYANHSPSYYDSDPLDGDSEIEKQPYFEVVITKNGSEFFRCRNDWPVYDTCGGNSVYDNNPGRGSSHTYSAYVEQYKRHSGCTESGNDLDPDCGKPGTLSGTSPSITKTVYVGTENPPRMQSNISYGNKQGTSRLLVLKGSEVSFSWSRGDAAGMQYAGDSAQYCVLIHTINGKKVTLEANAPESGSRVIPVGEILGQQLLSVDCYNGAGEDHPGSTGKTFEVVETIPGGYYDDAKQAGGGGAGIAVPVDNEAGDLDGNGQTDSEQPNLKNVYSPSSGTYVALGVDKCSITSSGFTASPVIADNAEEATYSYPFGAMAFTLGCETPGETVTVTKHYYTSASASDTTLRKISLTDGSTREIPEAKLENVTIGGKQAIKVTYPITDGGVYDEDGQMNGVIIDPVVLSGIQKDRADIETDCTAESLNKDNCKIISYIVIFTNILAGIVGIVVVIMIVIGGIQYSAAGSDPNGAAAAKKRITNAILALVAYLFTYAFLQWIVPGGIL